MPEEDLQKLRAIADKKRTDATDLMRAAAYAIIECYEASGDVPLEMAITQRAFHPRVLFSEEDVAALAAAEDATPYSTTQRLPTAAELLDMLRAARAASKSGDSKAHPKAS